MVEMSSYEPGIPSWVDVSSGDLPATVAFYKDLFGWDSFEPPGGGGYTILQQGGKSVAAAGPAMDPNAPESWTTYVNVADTDSTVARASGLGGRTLSPAMDIPIGRFAVLTDPRGAVFGIIALAAR